MKKIFLTLNILLIILSLFFMVGCGGTVDLDVETVSVEMVTIEKEGESVLALLVKGWASSSAQNYGFRVSGEDYREDFLANNMDGDGYFSEYLTDLPADKELNVRAFVGTATPEYGKEKTFDGFSGATESVEMNMPSISMMLGGEPYTLTVEILPSNYPYRSVAWSVEDGSVLSVVGGVLTPKKAGKTTVIATARDGATTQCVVTVREFVNVSVNISDVKLFTGETEQLYATVTPDTVSDNGVIWKSADTSIVKVDQNGLVTGVGGGTAFVYAYSVVNDTVYGSCKVTVAGEYSIKLNRDEITLDQGDEYTLIATILPEDINWADIVWSSSDESVVVVSGGKVTAVGKGYAKIFAKLYGVVAECDVLVKNDLTINFVLDGDIYATRYTGASQNNVVEIPKDPVDALTSDEPFYFLGWYSDKNYKNKVDKNTKFYQNATVYAKTESIFTYDVSDGCAVITGFRAGHEKANLIIPTKIGDYTVKAIDYSAFWDSDVETLTIRGGLTTIYDDAFRDSVSLDTVTFGKDVTLRRIGDSAFRGCTALTDIELPVTVAYVGELCFYGCTQIPKAYGQLYSKNLERKEYYSPKYVYEFLGEDTLPIGGYIEPSVHYLASYVTLEEAIESYIGSGTNIIIGCGGRAGNYSDEYRDMLIYLEKYGGMMFERTNSVTNPWEYVAYAGQHCEDEAGVIQWDESLYYYSPWEPSDGSFSQMLIGRQHVDQKNWKKFYARKLRLMNLLPINSPKTAFVFGATYYGYNSEIDRYDENGELVSKGHDLFDSYVMKYANPDAYYKSYIDHMNPDVFCYDFYPLWANGAGNEAHLNYPELNSRHFEQLYKTRYYAEDYNKEVYGSYVPFWNFVQICQWGNRWSGSRAATYSELMWQINTAFAFGSKGYQYYVFYDVEPNEVEGSGHVECPMNMDGTINKVPYEKTVRANMQSQAMAKWLLNANVDHLSQVGENPNGESIHYKMFRTRDAGMEWSLSSSSGKNHLVSYMKYYANNNRYDENEQGDVRELYFVCNNGTQDTNKGSITLKFERAVSGSYIYNGVEKTFSGTTLTVNTNAGEGFAVLLDK